MNEITIQSVNLPTKLEDISKFILVGREKLVAVRAEIRAIDKLQIAEDVRNQKKDEAIMLSEALLDAEVKLGDLLRQIPKVNSNQYIKKVQTDSGVDLQKNKKEIINNLGFSEKQANRFEMLANNKDLVEQVKEEARENDDIPTRTRVLDLAQQRKKREQEEQQKSDNYNQYLAECKKLSYGFHDVLYGIAKLEVTDENLKKWKELLDLNLSKDYLEHASNAIPKLLKIQNFLKEMIK